MGDSGMHMPSTKSSYSLLHGCATHEDPLGLLDLIEGEECLHVVRGSFIRSSHNPGHTLIVGTKSIHLRGGDEEGWRIRIPYEYISRWKVHENHWHRGVEGVAEWTGSWKVDSVGLCPDEFVPSGARVRFHVEAKERRRYQGKDSWHMAVERLVEAYRHGGDLGEVGNVYQGFLHASHVTSSPLGALHSQKRFECSLIVPFCEVRGECVVSDATGLRFSPYCSDSQGKVCVTPHAIVSIRKRQYILEQNACEIYYQHGDGVQSVFLVFGDAEAAKAMIACVAHMATSQPCDLETAQRLWRANKMSNFEYLLYLNDCAGRSFKNIYRYPIFPWVLSDYSSKILDLKNPQIYRDFTKPAAAMNKERVQNSLEIFQALKDSGIEHPWMHGSHYANPGVVVFFKVRQHPKLMLRLQGRRFDQVNRIFYNISSTWKSVCSASGNDVKELIPELYDVLHGYHLLKNSMGVCLGSRSDGRNLGDVEIPPWADSIEDFVAKMNMALESEHVSKHLHAWIDLVFGINSRGSGAVKHHNVFHYMTYDEMCVIYSNVFVVSR